MDKREEKILNFIDSNNRDRIREKEKIDKLLPTITAGTLVISITFLTNLVSKGKLIALKYLFLSWGFLIASLVLTIVAYIFVDWHFAIREKEFRKFIKSNNNIFTDANIWTYLTKIFDVLALIFTLIGIIILAYFGYKNIIYLNK